MRNCIGSICFPVVEFLKSFRTRFCIKRAKIERGEVKYQQIVITYVPSSLVNLPKFKGCAAPTESHVIYILHSSPLYSFFLQPMSL